MDTKTVDLSKDGEYDVQVIGDLTIHGITQNIETSGKFIVKEGKVEALSTFIIAVVDYEIDIPKLVRDNIAKEIEISVKLKLNPLEAKGSTSK